MMRLLNYSKMLMRPIHLMKNLPINISWLSLKLIIMIYKNKYDKNHKNLLLYYY